MENLTAGMLTTSEMLFSYSDVAEQSERFSELLDALAKSDIKSEGFPFTLGEDIAKLMEQFSEFPEGLAGDFTSTDPLQ